MAPISRRLRAAALPLALAVFLLAAPAHADVVSARALLEVVDFGPPVVSPDGRGVAYRVEQASVERNTYDTVWYVQSMDGDAPPHRVADGGVPLRDYAGTSVPNAAIWSPDGRWIYYRALVEGRVGIWRAAADGSGAAPMSDDAADIREFLLGDDGKTLFYSVGATREEVLAAEQEEYDQGVRIDETVPIGQGLVRSGLTEGRLATQRYRGVWFMRAPLLSEVPDRWHAIDVGTGDRRDVRSSDVPARAVSAAHLHADVPAPLMLSREEEGRRIALLTRVGDGRGLLSKPDIELGVLSRIESSRVKRCSDEQCAGRPIDRIQWRPGSDEVLFTVTDPAEALAQSIFRWNVVTGEVAPVVRAAGLISGGRSPSSDCGISAQALACVAADAGRPPRLERIDLDTGDRRVLFDPNAGLAQALARSVPVRRLNWFDAEGREFTGQFFPAQGTGDRPAPLFVNHYSCPGFVRGGVGEEWPLATLARHGISALCVNQLADYLLDPAARLGQGMAALQGVIGLLESEGLVDRERIGMGGLSMGSEIALWTAAESDLLVAVSASSTDVSPGYHLMNRLKGDTFSSVLRDLWGLGAPEDTPEQWRAVSTAFKLDRIAAPILFQQPEQEYVRGLELTIPLLLEHRADLYVFPEESHLKFQPKHLLAANERNLDWFRFWLQGVEDGDRRKAKQYAHWRKMRDRSCSGDRDDRAAPWYCRTR